MTAQRIAIIVIDGGVEILREFRLYDLAAGGVKTLANGNPAGRPVETTDPPFDPATEVREGPTITILADKVTEVFTVRAKTQEELDADQLSTDIGALRSAGKDVVLVLIELIDKLLADAVIAPTDFTPDVRQAYFDLKVIADRVKT
jgi:hypothetical protein